MSQEDDFFGGLTQSRVAIIGLGLMGGSLAMALRGKCRLLLGVDYDPHTLALARERQLVKLASSNPEEILPQADLVILAVPVKKIIDYLYRLPALHPGRAIVLDLGSTKKAIVQAMEALPGRFDPLGGHPMCGKETSSLENAEPELYQGAPFAFVPLERSTSRSRQMALELAAALGARPVWLEAEAHDRWVAHTSHVPYLLASALSATIPQEAAALAGPGYRSTARLAGSSIEMMGEILATNQVPVLAALQQVRGRLEVMAGLLERGKLAELEALLAEGKSQYEAVRRQHELTRHTG